MWIWFSVRFYSLITVAAYRCEELPLNSSEGEKIETCLFAIMLLILFFVVFFAFLSYCQHVLNTADNSVKAKWILFNVFLSSQSSSSSQHITTYTHSHARTYTVVVAASNIIDTIGKHIGCQFWFCLNLVVLFALRLDCSLPQMDSKICEILPSNSQSLYDNGGYSNIAPFPIEFSLYLFIHNFVVFIS